MRLVAAPRFAIYFVAAPDTALYRFGAAVLGYDCYTGEPVEHLHGAGLTQIDWAALTAEPRTYGFHATLKAPFRLRDELEPATLLADVRTFAASIRSIPILQPAVGLIGGFVAIVPRAPSPALERLAADCVTAFDRFRRPVTPEERSRRAAAGLSQRQTTYLERWGYPYVFEEFRFHMTLTGRIEADRRRVIHALLQDAFARRCGLEAIALDRLALMRQDQPDAQFHVIAHVPVSRPE
jgi:putative phosphonate metabolism protein